MREVKLDSANADLLPDGENDEAVRGLGLQANPWAVIESPAAAEVLVAEAVQAVSDPAPNEPEGPAAEQSAPPKAQGGGSSSSLQHWQQLATMLDLPEPAMRSKLAKLLDSTDTPSSFSGGQSGPLFAGSGLGGTADGSSISSNSSLVDQLDQGNEWITSTGTIPSVITYGFTTNNSFAQNFSEQSGWSAFQNSQKEAARLAMGLWDDLVAPSFVESTTSPNTADIKFSNTTNSGYAHAWFPGIAGSESGFYGKIAGSVWINPAFDATQMSNDLVTPQVGDHGFSTYVHEIGHAIGLEHAGNYNGGQPQYGNTNSGWLYVEDSEQYTIMSYFSADNTGADWGNDLTWYPYIWDNYAQTPMVYDILAIQQMYGADYTTRSGDTVYGFNATADRWIFDFTQNATPVLTIWDGGGIDTIDLSGWSTSATLSLVGGAYSSVNGMTYNLAIAYGADIENAIGGAGNDLLDGNDLANVITGNGGADIIHGFRGDDTLFGGTGADQLFGGGGDDILDGGDGADSLDGGDGLDITSYRTATSGLTISLANPALNTGAAAGDVYVSIEQIEGSAFGDILIGNDNDNTLYGGAGADVLDGGLGTDRVSYRFASQGILIDLTNMAANTGDATGDSFVSIEEIEGTRFADTLVGDGNGNTLFGGGGDDSLLAGAGHDFLEGGEGADVLDGGAGFDKASYATASSSITIDLSDQLNNGGAAAGDVLLGIEWIEGSEFGDTVIGDGGTNIVSGGNGDDSLSGDAGNDALIGGAGADILDGGTGQDNASYTTATSGVTIDLSDPSNNLGDAAGDVYIDIEIIQASNFSDLIRGNDEANIIYAMGGDDVIWGEAGADLIVGGAGNDTIVGGTGSDSLYGNSGNDTFVILSADVGTDWIMDFQSGSDLIDLSDFGFTSFDDVFANANQSSNDVMITFSESSVLYVANALVGDLDASNFVI